MELFNIKERYILFEKFFKNYCLKGIFICLALFIVISSQPKQAEASFLGDLFALPSCIVSGKIVDNNNTPIEGVEVKFIPDGIGNTVKVITDENGNYAFKIPVKTLGLIVVSKENFRIIKSQIGKYDFSTSGETYVRNYTLNPDYISGKIIDANNQPVANAEVVVELNGGIDGIKKVYTDENGNYRCKISKDSTYYWITIRKDGYSIIRDHIWVCGGSILNYTLRY